ncbi:MAG: SPOR domain-containing protein, partial [Methylococcaceae bacterium]
ITSLENQLADAMDSTSPLEIDAELDSLLGGAGFDFDSLLGEAASDELAIEIPVELEPEAQPEPELETQPEPEIEEDSLMTAVDELLHLGVSEDEIEAVVESELVNDVIENKIEVEENELNSTTELTVEPEAALDDLVDSVSFEDTLTVAADEPEIENFAEEFNNFDEVADSVAPLVEISTSDESFNDDLNAMQLDGLNEAMENKNDTTAGFDLLADDAKEKESATSVSESSDDDWMKQLEGLDDDIEPSAAVDLQKEVVEDDDWMKQLENLDDEETEKSAAVSLDKIDAEEALADDDDWMKQLEGLDEHDEDTANLLMDAVHETETKETDIVDRNFNITNEPETVAIEKSEIRAIDEEALIAKAADLAISQFKDEFKDDQEHIMSQLRADQDTIESRNKKQFVEAENKQKKTATFGYIALGVGVIGLLGSAGIGWLSYSTKDKTQALSESVTTLEEKVDGLLAKDPEKEIATIKTSVEQLNQKVEKLAAAQVVVPVPPVVIAPENGKTSPAVIDVDKKANSPVALLNNNVAPVTPETAPVKSAVVSVDEKAVDTTKTADMAKKAADMAKAEAAKTAKVEAEKVAKAEAQLLSEKIAKATAIAKAAASPTKTDEQRKLLSEKATRYTGRMTRGMARGIAKEKTETKKGIEKSATKDVLNTKIAQQKAVPVGKYSVNVVSYQQEWFAQSKAAEFKQKGIPVEVVPVEANKIGTRYRLKVAGFKNKAEANAYADKIKKSHNLGESWVGEN